MYLRRDQLTHTIRAPAKLNLFLEILGRRADGFHELETLMAPIGLSDFLRFTAVPPGENEAGDLTLTVRECYPVNAETAPADASAGELPSAVPAGAENLVVRALALLRERSDTPHGARVELIKRIPPAAGLGGGSSDAAAALRVANRVWELDWPQARLAELAAEIGSDVPFFLAGGAAVCRGRGEQVERVRGLRRLDVVIVKPLVGLSTAEVYRAHDALDPGARDVGVGSLGGVLEGLRRGQFARRSLHNGLQTAAAMVSSLVDKLRRVFDELDFVAHQLSGSGSAYFGICRHAQHARRLAVVLRSQRLGLVYATRSCA